MLIEHWVAILLYLQEHGRFSWPPTPLCKSLLHNFPVAHELLYLMKQEDHSGEHQTD